MHEFVSDVLHSLIMNHQAFGKHVFFHFWQEISSINITFLCVAHICSKKFESICQSYGFTFCLGHMKSCFAYAEQEIIETPWATCSQ